MFSNIEKLLYQIKNTLLGSPNIKKLAFHNTSNALSKVEPTYEEAANNIYLKPIIFVDEDSKEFSNSTFISIGWVEEILSDSAIKASIKITVACDREIWELDNNKVRVISLISEISDLLENYKFNIASTMKLKVVANVYFNKSITGYTLLFDIYEEKGSTVNEF